MSHLPIHPSKRHPLTGALLQAVGVLPNGKIIWPILGGDDTIPPVERPDGVTTEEWEALGDPGKKAIVREREKRVTAEQALAAARARPAPPKPVAKGEPTAAAGDPADVSAIVKQVVEAALKPFQEREAARDVEAAAGRVRDAVIAAATSKLIDPTDSLQIDLTSVIDEQGVADGEKVARAIDALVAEKPHLAKSNQRFAPVGIGGGSLAGGSTEKDAVAAALARMQKSTGVRLPSE